MDVNFKIVTRSEFNSMVKDSHTFYRVTEDPPEPYIITWTQPLAYANGGYLYRYDSRFEFPNGIIGQFMNEPTNTEPKSETDSTKGDSSKIAYKQIVYQDVYGIWQLADPYQTSGEIYINKGSKIYLQTYCNTPINTTYSGVDWYENGKPAIGVASPVEARMSCGYQPSSDGLLSLTKDLYDPGNDNYAWYINFLSSSS